MPGEHSRRVYLSFDLEEFDIPLEYGHDLPVDRQMAVTREGLEPLLRILEELDVAATFFTTARFAGENRQIVRNLRRGRHELASHGFNHQHVPEEDLRRSKLFLEDLAGEPVTGYRSPRMEHVAESTLAAAGYQYNSSDNPVYLPGRYNNFGHVRTAHLKDGVLNIPASATPLIRFPLFWLSFKNLPSPIYNLLTTWTLNHDRYLNVYFHPWEFAELDDFPLPAIVKRVHGVNMRRRFQAFVRRLKKRAVFHTLRDFPRETARRG